MLKKANAKKGREQLEKAGKPDATDVAQNLGSSGINLGIGFSTLLLAALIPPLGIPLILAAAGFIAKGSFQGLSGVWGAAEVAVGAIKGAARYVHDKKNFDNDDREPAKAAKKARGDYQEYAQEYGKNIKVDRTRSRKDNDDREPPPPPMAAPESPFSFKTYYTKRAKELELLADEKGG